jgi:hypothetical protein
VCVNCASTDLWGVWVACHPDLPGDYDYDQEQGPRIEQGHLAIRVDTAGRTNGIDARVNRHSFWQVHGAISLEGRNW